MDYMSTDFGADSSSHLPFRARTDRQTDALPHAGSYTAGVGNECQLLGQKYYRFYQLIIRFHL